MTEAVDSRDATPDKERRQTELAPVGIRHLLLLTACTAVAFAVYGWLIAPSTQTVSARIAGFFYCLIYGGALTGLCMFVARMWRGIPTLKHPGHLLLLFAGIGAVLDGLVELVVQFGVWMSWSDVAIVMGYYMKHIAFIYHKLIGYCLITLIAGCMYFVVDWGWRLGFIGLWGTFFVQAITHLMVLAIIYQWLPYWLLALNIPEKSMSICALGCTVLLGTAAFLEYRERIKREWLHWCGLIAVFLLACLEWFRVARILFSSFLD